MSAKGKIARRLLGICLLLLLLGGCASRSVRYAAPELLEPKGVTLDTAAVVKGSIWKTTTLEGVVLPGVRELSFSGSGLIREVSVCAGRHVQAGDVLASMDVSYLEGMLISQRENLEYQESLEAITQREQDIQIRLQELTLESLKDSGASRSAIRLQELEIEKLCSARDEERALWEMDHAVLLEGVAELEAQIAAARIIAPCDGTIVACTAADGGYAMENLGVIWLAEDAALYVSVEKANLLELNGASEVYATVAGQRIEVAYRQIPDRNYMSRTSSTGSATSAFDILDDNGNPVEAGMSAVVFVLSDKVDEALIVPATAIRNDGENYVYKVVDGVQVRQNVKVGVMNAGEVQILDGLQEGDVVYAGT